ncbi:MAG: type II/IV secretion system ATPase subunit [Candidatus Thermoplasmatota archaeon]|jgi:flagellar protein FlaI|nr:type II/IV secretion system ATPase subunit [Candidatus Thermoplasmatota archaeon]
MFKKKERVITTLDKMEIKLNDTSSPDDLSFEEIEPGMVYTRVFQNKNTGEININVIEPFVDDSEKEIIEKLKNYLVNLAAFNGTATTDRKKDFEAYFPTALEDLDIRLGGQQGPVIKYYVERDVVGYGRIDALMKDPSIEDISCDSSTVPVFVFHREHGYIMSNVKFADDTELNRYVKKLIQDSGKHISISIPIIDATLRDGSRIQASYGKFITNNGPAFTIRKFRASPLSPISLVMAKSVSAKIFAYLWVITEYGSNMMVAGGTGSGKTTLLNAILLFIPPQMKVISIEDTREINIPHENWISGVTRPGFGALDKDTGKRAGEIDMFDLLAASLRQRPNYVVIGEVRGKEAFTVFQAMSAGRYGFGTFHAEDPKTLIYRLESQPINVPRTLITALDVILMQSLLNYNGKIVRRVTSVSEITGLDPSSGDIVLNNIFKWNPQNDQFQYSGFSYVMNRIAERTGRSEQDLEKEVKLREVIINKMIQKKYITYKDVTRMIIKFYKDRENLLKDLEIVESEVDSELSLV